MSSVTQRIKEIKQPKGGYINPSSMKKIQLNDGIELNEEENIHASLVGLVIDYMTRFLNGTSKEKAFFISLLGAKKIQETQIAQYLLDRINGIDNESIICACKLVGYDVCFRAGSEFYKSVIDINPDDKTISNIKIMIRRSLNFFKEYGPIIQDGITFSGGYTSTINSGDADFLTKDTLWDFKVSKASPKTEHTLQLLVYYLMGKHSNNNNFNLIKKLGIFNPRKNTIYLKEIAEIDTEIIQEVEQKIIGYNNEDNSKLYQTDSLLGMSEIMKILSCTRYMVMKYYSEDNLPLIKKNNRYYINKYELECWIQMMEEERKRQQLIAMYIGIGSVVIAVLIIFIMLWTLL